MKFQGKFASFQQLNSLNSRDNFQICCIDKYLIRFLANFAVFRTLLWISRDFAGLPEIRGSATALNIRYWYCELLHLHYTNWRLKTCTWWLHFSSLSPKDDLKIFLISSPAMSTPRKSWPEKTEGIWPTVLQGSTGETASWNWRRWPSSCEGEAT